MVRGLEESLRETSVDTQLSLNKLQTLDTSMAVLLTRVDRIEKDAQEAEDARTKQSHLIWGALLAALFSVTIPYFIHPGTSHSSSSK